MNGLLFCFLLVVGVYMRVVVNMILSDRSVGERIRRRRAARAELDARLLRRTAALALPCRVVWYPESEPTPASVLAIRREWAADFAQTRRELAEQCSVRRPASPGPMWAPYTVTEAGKG